jgi:hypothetical protein
VALQPGPAIARAAPKRLRAASSIARADFEYVVDATLERLMSAFLEHLLEPLD